MKPDIFKNLLDHFFVLSHWACKKYRIFNIKSADSRNQPAIFVIICMATESSQVTWPVASRDRTTWPRPGRSMKPSNYAKLPRVSLALLSDVPLHYSSRSRYDHRYYPTAGTGPKPLPNHCSSSSYVQLHPLSLTSMLLVAASRSTKVFCAAGRQYAWVIGADLLHCLIQVFA